MQYDSFGNLLQVRGDVVRLPIGFAGGLFDADTGLTRFVWRDYDADTGRFTALDPMGAKGGDTDWYGYCVDDPVNRVDAWKGEGEKSERGVCNSPPRWRYWARLAGCYINSLDRGQGAAPLGSSCPLRRPFPLSLRSILL